MTDDFPFDMLRSDMIYDRRFESAIVSVFGEDKTETIAVRLSFAFRYDRLPDSVRMENRRNKPQNA